MDEEMIKILIAVACFVYMPSPYGILAALLVVYD